jgi:hypothetical protein
MERGNELGAVGLREFMGYADRANNRLIDSLTSREKTAAHIIFQQSNHE